MEIAVIPGLLARGVHGLVLMGAQRPAETWALLEAADAPVVLTWCGDPRMDAVLINNKAARRLVTEHLRDLGHHWLGIICGALRHNDRQSGCVTGVRQALMAQRFVLSERRIVDQELIFDDIASTMRDALLNWPARAAGVIATELGAKPQLLRTILQQHINELLTEASDRFDPSGIGGERDGRRIEALTCAA